MGILDYIYAIFAFIIVFGLLIFSTRFLSYKSKKVLNGKYMQVIESLSLGVNNRLHLIKIDNEFFLISATNKNVEFLTKVNIGAFKEEEIKNPITEIADFKSVLKKYTNFNFSSKKENESQDIFKQDIRSSGENQESDLIFKNNLKKLKNLTNTINGQRSEDEQKKEH
ncbi:flagellar biosynthetic protein FliO [Ruminiclostridium herbifermentans]|uniref:Flagellar biosynthetic protein FliO n=1 Tax=Ruminiclostridium herbifermentans TaxID=2488810 RepID=A0A4U7JL24_9FIRM|nr:flagellar biosynthetic protein FliO [Ruminiclostridium herbifermentans]QNU68399.1 flagellar biosynthetic protein FliO [Ruminiclostridium herbifermentans]